MSSKDLGITVRKADDLSEWYTQIVTKAQLADYSSAKGFMVLMPYGFSIWESIKEHFDQRIKEIGHRNAYFPLLIPERLLKREAEHFEGFTPEVFWVTHSGNNELGERLAIRPTSETIINDAYSRWVKSWRDLPVLINVWNSVVRAEITSTKPFIRTSEFLWQEGHTVHETEEEAEKEVMTILEIYRRLVEDQIAIPVLVGKKTEREKFKGAVYTTTLEAMMPDGKAIQMGTSHHLGQNFSKPFEIKGVPLRVEIGPRDMESKQITLVRRDTGKKTAVPQGNSVTQIVNTLDEIQQSLLHKAKESQAKLTTTANNMKEFVHIIETTGGFVKAFLSEDNDCEERIKLETGATVRIVHFEESARGQCVSCGHPNSREVVFARSY